MKIRRWAGRGIIAVALGGASLLVTACIGGDGESVVRAEEKPAAASVKADDMVKSEAAASQYMSITISATFGAGCVNAAQCQGALNILEPFAAPLASALEEEAGADPDWKGLVDLASAVAQGVQNTEPTDNQAMNALLKDVVKLKEQLQVKDLGHI